MLLERKTSPAISHIHVALGSSIGQRFTAGDGWSWSSQPVHGLARKAVNGLPQRASGFTSRRTAGLEKTTRLKAAAFLRNPAPILDQTLTRRFSPDRILRP
jgi:hypothetical protein